MRTDRRLVTSAFIALFACIIFFLIAVPFMEQDQSFHLFADTRALFGIPNFWNVVSNFPFVVLGVAGLAKLRSVEDRVMFAGVLAIAAGSAYYHWMPNDARLVWDRLPMTVVFMSLLPCVVGFGAAERFRVGMLALLVSCGVASVFWWQATGDLRPYVLVQFARF